MSDKKSDFNIFSPENLINSNYLINSFWDYTLKNFKPNKLNDTNKTEIELVYNLPSLEMFSTLFNYSNSGTNTYLELACSSSKDKSSKIRYRQPISSFYSYVQYTKTNLITNFLDKTWEEKTTSKIQSLDGKFLLKTATETSKSYDSNEYPKEHITFTMVTSVFIKNIYFTAEIKSRTNLFTNSDSNKDIMLSYFKASNLKRYIDFEIEVNQLPDIEETKFKTLLLKIMQQSFGVNKDTIYFCFKPLFQDIKTFTIDLADLFNLNYHDVLIMKKIDGEPKQFYVKNGICYILKNHIMNELVCNIDSSYELCGTGEFFSYNGIRTIIPFYYEFVYHNNKPIIFKSRIESLSFIAKIIKHVEPEDSEYHRKISIIPNETLGIRFSYKEIIGPFNDLTEFISNFLEFFKKTSAYPTDGVIIAYNTIDTTGKKEIQDYKFKANNTVDLFTNFEIDQRKNDVVKVLKFDLSQSILFETKDKKKIRKFQQLYQVRVAKSEDFCFDEKILMLVQKKNGRSLLFPVVFIAEYFIDQNIFVPRIDKTNKFYENRNYFGNPMKSVIKCRVIHNYNLNFDQAMLEKLIIEETPEKIKAFVAELSNKIANYTDIENNLLMNKIKDVKNEEAEERPLTSTIKEKNYIFPPLNQGLVWYKTKPNKRYSLNVFSNLNKTQGITGTIGKIVNKSYDYSTVFSIYGGKGGDIGKYVINNISFVVAVDPDEHALEVFMNRRNSYSNEKTNIFQLITIPLALEERDFLGTIYSHIGMVTFDVIDIQLGIHFSLTTETEDHIMDIIKTLSNKSSHRPPTKVLISTNDKDEIMDLFTKRGIDKKTTPLRFMIDGFTKYEINYINDKKISIFYPESMDVAMEEYLMSSSYIFDLFKKHGYRLEQSWTFDETVHNEEIYSYLSQKFVRTSSNNFLTMISKIDSSQKDLADLLSIFRYYIFEKE